MLEINPEKLIKAVRARPALYNKKDSMYYCHRKHKEKLWRDVSVEVYPIWETLKPVEKVECVREIQKRWKSLRTCFSRELALQRKERFKEEDCVPVKKRRKYSHYDSMTFLLDDSPEQFDLSEDSNDPLEASFEPTEVYEFNHTTPENINISNIVPGSYEMPVPVYEKTEELETKVLTAFKELKRNDEDDDDKQFMLSLVPMFRKLTDKQKMEARIDMLKVIQRVTFDDSK